MTTNLGLASFATAAPMKKRVSKFQWFGVNESGAEFGEANLPGTLGTDYTWPSTSTIDTLYEQGFNIFRVNILMERLTPDSLTGSFNSTYLAGLTSTVSYITDLGADAVIEPHNFGRYYSEIITDTSGFEAWWKKVATEFASNSKVIFDTNNEYHDMDQTLVLDLNQAAINGIRAAGATSQYIFVEGNSYSGAWTWVSVNDNLKDLTDSEDKIVYEMHQYLDSDGSGTSDVCVNSTIGKARIESATNWLRENGKIGILGEFAGGANSVCQEAIEGMLEYMGSNTDVWKGAMWWAAGPWWGDYIFSFEPPSGIAYTYYLSTLKSLYRRAVQTP